MRHSSGASEGSRSNQRYAINHSAPCAGFSSLAIMFRSMVLWMANLGLATEVPRHRLDMRKSRGHTVLKTAYAWLCLPWPA